MIRSIPEFNPKAPIIVIDIGNSTIEMATWADSQLRTPLAVAMEDRKAFEKAFDAHAQEMPNGRVAAAAIASVNSKALAWVQERVEERIDQNALVIGKNMALPMETALKDPDSVGVDRLCAAAAAYETVQSSCVVVDLGTAVTVDLVDDEGVFRGGAILPGLALQLRALHEHTAALPLVNVALPDHAVGRNTTEAIQNGVCRGLAGAIRILVEGYAAELNRWPHVIATGGDLDFFGEYCDFLDTQVKQLALRGVGVSYQKHLAGHDV